METKILLKDVRKNHGKLIIIDGISFDVQKNEFLSIIGPSGCGKTTLLYMIQGFTKKTSGRIEVNGKKGFVFQDNNLFPWKTVKENIEVGPLNKGISKRQTKKIVSDLIKEFGIEGFENNYPHQISEGMKQRVDIGRCVANNPEILLMDEPFGSLDFLTRLKMQDFLLSLKQKMNLTIVFVTHDIDEAIKLSDRIIVLSKRPARILDIINVNNETDKIKFKEGILELISAYSNFS